MTAEATTGAPVFTLDIPETARAITWAWKADRIPFLIGVPGIGKTSVVEQLVEDVRAASDEPYGFVYDILSNQTAVDRRGIPDIDRDNKTAQWYLPERVPFEGNGILPERGIWFMDEPGRAEEDVLNTLTPLLTARKVDGKPIKPGWRFIFADNAFTDSGTIEFTDALLDRACILYVHVRDTSSVVTYGASQGWDDTVLSWLERDDYLLPEEPEWEELARKSPRSAEYLSDLLRAQAKLPFETADIFPAVVQGCVTLEGCLRFFSHLAALNKIPSIEEIDTQPSKAMIPTDKQSMYQALAQLGQTREGNNTLGTGKANARLKYISRLLNVPNTSPELLQYGLRVLGKVAPTIYTSSIARDIMDADKERN